MNPCQLKNFFINLHVSMYSKTSIGLLLQYQIFCILYNHVPLLYKTILVCFIVDKKFLSVHTVTHNITIIPGEFYLEFHVNIAPKFQYKITICKI